MRVRVRGTSLLWIEAYLKSDEQNSFRNFEVSPSSVFAAQNAFSRNDTGFLGGGVRERKSVAVRALLELRSLFYTATDFLSLTPLPFRIVISTE